MNTSALRIGNHVLHEGKIIAVTSVFPKGINAHTDPATGKVAFIRAATIDPVPLSSEMLRRLGFRTNAIRWVLQGVSDLYVDRMVDKFYISIARRGDKVCQVQFIHQFQNLFADGWGVELKWRR